MKSNHSVFLMLLCILNVTFVSCDKEEDGSGAIVTPTASAVYIINEGAFGAGNSSISFLNLETGVLTNNIFESVNGIPLGDVAQSMTIHQGKGYIVVNNSQKIEVVNIDDFTSINTFSSFDSPRHLMPSASKGYVCDWIADEVKVVDLNTGSVIKHIPTGAGPDQSTISGSRLFVANVGGFGNDSTVTVIDLFGDSVLTTLQVGINPNSIVTDKFGKVWVLCGGSVGPDYIGGTSDDLAGSLWRINPNTYDIEKQFNMNSDEHPVKMVIYGDKTKLAYLLGNDGYFGQVVRMDVSAPGTNHTPVINKTFYGLGINESNNDIYCGAAPGFSQNGSLFRYTNDGTLIDSMEVGIAPHKIVFK